MIRRRSRTSSWLAPCFALLVLAGCRDTEPTAPAALAGEEPGTAIRLDVLETPPPAVTMGWLAPLGTTSAAAPHDAERRPVVTICRWVNRACVGAPVARFAVGSGLTATGDAFAATWSLTAPGIPLARTTFRIAVTLDDAPVGLPIVVEVMRGRWAISIPGRTATLIAAASLPLRFRLGAPTAPPPPQETVEQGLQSASTQFFPSMQTSTPRTTEQTAALTTLATSLGDLQTALAGPREPALLALSQATLAANVAFDIAPPGDKADLDVIRLELAQAGRLLGVSN